MPKVVLIAHNIRSSHNVGSLLRTADGLGVDKVYLTGYTPYPAAADDARLPHLARKIDAQITKTSLGAEKSVEWQHTEKVEMAIKGLRADGYKIAALEQTTKAIDLAAFTPPEKTALIVGREVEGVEPEVLGLAEVHLEIPMRGSKESFNVAVAAAIALYSLKN